MQYKILIGCLFWMLTSWSVHAQTGVIRGTVLDGKTNQPLPFASVYINYTTIGTYTDSNGEFMLSGLGVRDYDLIVSYVGHLPYQKTFTLTDGGEFRLTIRLEVSALQEVQITGKRDEEWEKQLKKFIRLFIGTSDNAKYCRIMNPWALSFQKEKGGLFIASASEALEIENLSLGYQISYQLRNFSLNHGNYFASGFVRFRELESVDPLIIKKWLANRNEAYQGSTRHLFKTMIEHCLEEETYSLYEDKSGLEDVTRISRFLANLDKTIFNYSMDGKIYPLVGQNAYTIKFPQRIEVHYKEKNVHSKVYWDIPYPVSWIEVTGGSLKVTDDGIVLNPINMTISGYMFDARIADILPNDYRPEITYTSRQQAREEKVLTGLANLVEKPYIQTDKSYYYPNEVIWMKGYMNYLSSVAKDSLSSVLYVDLLNANSRIVASAVLPVYKGLAIGNMDLPSTIEKGDYTLRAYTRWMLNFDSTFVFASPLKILGRDERVRTGTYVPSDQNMLVQIATDREYYSPREKITITLNVVDQMDQSLPAEMSVAVTDLQQVVPPKNETNILDDFTMPTTPLPDSIDPGTRYRIQRGFDLQGTFVPARGKKTQGLLTLVQHDSNMELTINTETDGSFFLPNLLLYDSSTFSLVARTLQGRPGKVIFDSVIISPPARIVEPLELDIEKILDKSPHYVPEVSNHAIMLDEVSVKAPRIERNKTSVIMPDYEVTGMWMRDSHITSVLSGIQMKVPGIRIFISTGPDGFLQKTLVMGGPSSLGGLKAQEPLVLIDNIVVNDMIGGPAEQIDRLNPAEIESVEVIKFGNGAAYGARGGNGIILIHTRRGGSDTDDTPGNAYDKNMLKPIHTPGFSSRKNFIAPRYPTPDDTDGIPDYRATIYWNPMVSTDPKKPAVLTFYAADLATQYRVVVEGVTPDGSPVRGEKIITVRKDP